MSELSGRLKREIDLRAHLARVGVKVNGKMARCPFHEDGRASLSVSRKDGAWVWHCFGCGAGGSIIDFEMKRRGIAQGEAIRLLAEEHGLAEEHEPRPAEAGPAPAPTEVFKEAIAHVYRSARRNFLEGEAPAAARFLEAKGIPRETAVRCGLGATRLTKKKYRRLMAWCRGRYGVSFRDLGLGGLFFYAERGLTLLVYPYWPDFSPPDPSCAPDELPPVRYLKLRPCVSRADAERMGVQPHFRPKGRECSDPWCPVGLPGRGEVLWIAEGETDCMTVIARGETACAMPGAGARLPRRFVALLRERGVRVHVVADADDAGERMLAERTRELAEGGVEARAFRLPREVEGRGGWGKDVNDLVLALPEERRPAWQELLVEIEAEAPRGEVTAQRLPATSPSSPAGGRASVCTTDLQLRDMIARSWSALHARNDPPQLFRQGEDLAYLGVDPDDMKKPEAERKPAILPVTETVMNGMLLRAADWVRTTSKGDMRPSRPPHDVGRDMVHFRPLPGWLPKLESVTSTPSYGPDLEMIAPGYHAELRLAFLPSVGIAPPQDPSAEDAARAVAAVNGLLQDFPFQTPADRANQIGVMLLSLLRPAIKGNVPLVAIVATIQRSGKGTLCAITETLMTGTNASQAQYSGDPEEFRKALLPYISRGQPIIRLDNVDDGSELSSPHLASALTEGWYCDRVLGQSEVRAVPVRTIFLATGNKMTVSRDLLYRTMWIRLAPETDEPDKREFAIDEIEAHMRECRAEYLTALATMVERWKATGARPWLGRRWNSFNPFVRTVGGVLAACGVEGFLGNADEQRAAGNPGEEEWRRVLGCWREATGECQPANWLLEHVFDPCEPLAHISIGGKTEVGRARSLSRLLGREVGRPRSMADGAVVHIARSRNTHGNRDLFGLVTRAREDCEHSSCRPDYPRTMLARIRPPLGRGEDSEQSEDNFYPRENQNSQGVEPEKMFCMDRGSETSALSSLCSPALTQQGLTERAYCEDSGPAPSLARAPSPEPPGPLVGRGEADAASADVPDGLPADPSDWPVEWRHTFRARAAHLLTTRGLPQEDAEHEAREFVLGLFREAKLKERA